MTDVIAVKHIGVHSAMEQLTFKRLRNGRFSSARKAGEPNDRLAMSAPNRAFRSGNFSLSPKNIFALRNSSVRINSAKHCAASTDLPVVHDYESTEIRNAIMLVNYERAPSLDN